MYVRMCVGEYSRCGIWRGRGYVDRRGIRRCTSNMCNRRDARDIDMQIWDDDVQKDPRAVRRASKVRYAMVIYGVGKFQHGIGLHQGTLPA